MKKIIRWLSDVSGVTRDIRTEQIRETGGRLHQDHFWWNGGITFKEPKVDLMNAFYLYSRHMKEYGAHPDIQRIREEIYKTKDYIGNK